MAKKVARSLQDGRMLKLAVVLMAFALPGQISCLLKLTNAQCESLNRSWVIVNECRIRAVSRDRTIFNYNATILHAAHHIKVNYYFARKGNGYRPFLWNITIDACQFMLRRDNPIANVLYGQFRHISNINHTCPYEGDQVIVGLHPSADVLSILPISQGEFALFTTWYFNGLRIMLNNFFFEYRT